MLVPTTAWAGPGQRPVVSFQTAEDSVASQCAPSYVLQGGPAGVTSIATSEVPLMEQLLATGDAVISSDYEGPDSEFVAAGQEGHGVLDGIEAALHYGPDGLSAASPLGMWGYSGGAFATAWAAQLAPTYAPSLHFDAIAMGGVPSEAVPAFEQISGGFGSGLVFGALIGLQRADPSAFTGLFTPAGQQMLDSTGEDCSDQLVATYAFQPVSDDTTTPQPFSDPKLVALLDAISPVGHGAPAGTSPIYDYHADNDELIPVATDNALVAQYCAAGDTVQIVRYTAGEHVSTELTGAAGAEAFLADRFSGQAPVDNCPSAVATTTKASSAPAKHKAKKVKKVKMAKKRKQTRTTTKQTSRHTSGSRARHRWHRTRHQHTPSHTSGHRRARADQSSSSSSPRSI